MPLMFLSWVAAVAGSFSSSTVIVTSTGYSLSIVTSNVLRTEAIPTQVRLISVTPISSAEVVAAVRRGLRTALATAIREYEGSLVAQLLAGLREKPGVKVWGMPGVEGRAPTVALTVEGQDAGEVARRLAADEIYAWSGHFYALELAEALGVLAGGGFVRLGLAHYNTADEVRRVLRLL